MKKLKKLTAAAALVFMLAGCGGEGDTLRLSGNLKEFSAKNYTINLPEECSVIASEIADLSATAGKSSVSVVSMPLSQTIICENKKDFQKRMDSIGYNLKAESYEKKEIDGVEVYAAEYVLEDSKITQLTYVCGDTAYAATYARPEKSDSETEDIFKKALESLKIDEE